MEGSKDVMETLVKILEDFHIEAKMERIAEEAGQKELIAGRTFVSARRKSRGRPLAISLENERPC